MCDAYRTETRESGTMSFRIEWVYDHDCDPPWDREDGHGPVSDWEHRSKRPGEMVLADKGRGRAKMFYDFAQAVKTARMEGWDTAPYKWPTNGARAHAAALADFNYLQRYCRQEWHYCGIVVTLLDADGEPDSVDASLWGIESEGDGYHEELIAECLSQITATIGE